jgi:hypothetical protein
MRRLWVAFLLTAMFGALTGFSKFASSASEGGGLKKQLVGTWRVVAVDDRRNEQDAWAHSYGQQPTGYFIYDTTGHVSIQIGGDPPPARFTSGNDRTPTPEEAKAAYLNYLAYFGTYTVDENRHIVTHHVEGSLVPSYTATDQERPFTIEGDRLEIGDGKTWRRVLQRVK